MLNQRNPKVEEYFNIVFIFRILHPLKNQHPSKKADNISPLPQQNKKQLPNFKTKIPLKV